MTGLTKIGLIILACIVIDCIRRLEIFHRPKKRDGYKMDTKKSDRIKTDEEK